MSLGKRIAGSTLVLSLSNASVRLLALFTMPLLTRLLAPEAYGAAALAGTVISLVSMIALGGVDMSYTRDYRARQGPSGMVLEAFAWRYALGAGFVFATMTAVAWWLVLAGVFHLPKYLAGLLFCGILLSLTNVMSLARARLNNRYGLMSMALVASAFASVAVSVGVAVWWRRTELPLVLSMLVGYLAPVLILGGPSLGVLIRPSTLSPPDWIAVLRIGAAGVLTAPLYWVISSLDRWFLGYFEGAASVGIYSIGYNVAMVGMMVNTALLAIWLPEAAKAYEEDAVQAQVQLGYLADRLIVGLGVVWLAVTASGGDIVRLLASPRFHEAAEVVPFIAGAVFFHGVLHLFNATVLLKKKLYLTLWWWGAAGMLCVVLNLLLVPSMGRVAAAAIQTLTFSVAALGVCWTGQSQFALRMRSFRMLAALGTMVTIGVFMAPAWAATPLASLLFKAPVGLFAAVIVLWAMAPEVLGLLSRSLPPLRPFSR